jgi:hypothetical protein
LWICLFVVVPVSQAGNGALGIFTDTSASNCDLSVARGQTRTFYVVFLPEGDTRGGINGVEFQVDPKYAGDYLVMGEQLAVAGAISEGQALAGGVTMAWAECNNELVIPVLAFQVLNLGNGASDTPLFVGARARPTNPNFNCALAILCDFPTHTSICISGGQGVLNATSEVSCGSGAHKKKWSRVKALYR